MKLKMSKMFLCTMLSIAFLCSAILFGVYSISNANVSTSGSIIYSVPVATTVSSATSQVSGTLSLPSATASAINNLTIKGNSVQYNILPSEYQEVEYIESTGTQYIDTGIKPTISDTVKPKISFEYQWTTLNVSERLFGVSSSSFYFQFYKNISPVSVGVQMFNTNTYTTFTADTNWHTVEIDVQNSIAKFDNNESELYFSNNSLTNTIYLFGRNTSNEVNSQSKSKISFWEYDDGTQHVKLIPCYEKSTGTVGMYDTVNKEVLTNKGTGEFKTGVSVLKTDGYQQVEYIQSSGTQYIDTGFKANQDTSIKMLATSLSTATQSFFSSRTGPSSNTFSCFIVSSKIRHDYYTQQLSINVTATAGLTYDIYANKNVLTVNGVTNTIGKTNFQSTGNMYIGASYNNGFANYFIGKIYYVKIYDNGTLVRDYVPCYKTSDSTIGLYDLVNNVFYENKGTETFSKGSNFNAPSPDNPQEIQSVGEKTKNLFNANAIKNTNIKVSNNGATITMPIIEGSNNNGYTGTGTKLIEACPDLKVGDKVVVSFTRNSNKNGLIYLSGSNYQWNRNTAKVITEEDLNSTLVLYANRASDGETGVQIVISDMQIEKGSTATDYEPYGYKVPVELNGTTHNIYLDEPLRAIGDVADELTISENGTINVTRKIFERTFDGTESWVVNPYSATLGHTLYRVSLNISAKSAASLCNVGTFKKWDNVLADNRFSITENLFIIRTNNSDSVDVWKNYVKQQYANGTPVTLCYQLATEQTTTLSQTLVLNTVKGDNTLSIATEVTPVDISVVYMKKG